VLVLCHGATLERHSFDDLGARLAGRHRVIAWDLPGHGESQPMPADFSVAQAAAALGALLDHEGVPRAVLIGNSMGGDVAQEFLFRCPGRVGRLVLLGSVSVTRPVGALDRLRGRIAAEQLRIGPIARFRRRVAEESSSLEGPRAYARACIERMSRADLVRLWRAIAATPHAEPDYRLPCPTRLIVGDEDRIGGGWVRDQVIAFARREPRAELVRIAGAGHLVHLDAPEEVAAAIEEFLRE
jgi:pimeloyl-ACP methyl ester carboxylesterase